MLLDRMLYPSLDKIRYVNTCKHSHTEMTEDSELEHRFTHTKAGDSRNRQPLLKL